ncbi:unnamed protein product [Dracunculus medinensis]|uniref:glutamine--tRNA ligase n=1 Tax=Dracunculus medinensis TaxID=318479 RepID=A0A0N4U3X4_DRAME|nr:unnamed protein product [Dracunculus medinensis]
MAVHLQWLGLGDNKINETLKNTSLTDLLIIKNNEEITKQMKILFYHLGTKMKPQCHQYLPLIIRHIINGNITNEPRLILAINYILSHVVDGIAEDELLAACGAGIVVTPEEIEDEVAKIISKYKEDLLSKRYNYNVGKIVSDVKSALKWADGASIKKEVDTRIMLLLGPKTLEEMIELNDDRAKKVNKFAKDSRKKQAISNNKPEDNFGAKIGAATIEELMRRKVHFHKVGENYKTDGYIVTPKTMELLKKHVKEVDGKVVTRFPPEPNGILHIGHAKAINIDFGYAKVHGGICYLRFDDTNPEKEEERFFKDIEDVVHWLGYKPYKVTHSSDYFDQLYDWAVELIKKNLAYVCHQRVDEIRGFEVIESPWRNRPVEESLQLFEDMKRGKFDEGAATLRLKVTLEEGKIDPVAYRIKYCSHPRSGDKWCIYPTYDYTHCLCDSIENITHSLCTKEFQSRRSSYYWLCNALDIYCPVQWEYGRLNMNYTVVSKRKIKALIDNKIVSDWDDPRLFTLTALRRRGVPAEAINNFVAGLGITGAQMSIDTHMFDAAIRDYLNNTAPRSMVVLEPLKVIIENFDELSLPSTIEILDLPSETDNSAKHTVRVDRIIYIEQSDCQLENAGKDYRRLSKTQSVGLKHLGLVLTYLKDIKDDSNKTVEVVVHGSYLSSENKPKAFIHWVAKPVSCEVRLYGRLFKHRHPEDQTEVPNGFLSDCDPDSLKIMEPVYIDQSIAGSKVYDRYQFERIGFFAVDRESTLSKLIFNRIVSLKEDSGRNK